MLQYKAANEALEKANISKHNDINYIEILQPAIYKNIGAHITPWICIGKIIGKRLLSL